MAEEGPVDVLWEGGSCCMLGGVGSIPKSKDEMGDSSRNDRGVGGRMSDPIQGCGVGGKMVGRGDGCGVNEGMVRLWKGIGGRDNPRGSNWRTKATSGRSCAHAWARRSSCLLIRGLRDRRLYTFNRMHCRQHLSNVLVVLHGHWVTPQQTDVSFNLHMEKPHILVMQYQINNANQ